MEHLNQTIRVKFGLAISQLVDVVRIEDIDIVVGMCLTDVKLQYMNVQHGSAKRHQAI